MDEALCTNILYDNLALFTRLRTFIQLSSFLSVFHSTSCKYESLVVDIF